MIEIPISKSVKLISPRLTVLINTVDEEGELNSSPYSWIFPLSFNPPLIGVGIGVRVGAIVGAGVGVDIGVGVADAVLVST